SVLSCLAPSPPRSSLFPYTTLFRSEGGGSPLDRLSEREFDVFLRLARGATVQRIAEELKLSTSTVGTHLYNVKQKLGVVNQSELDRKSTRLNSSHVKISYAVFCLKK